MLASDSGEMDSALFLLSRGVSRGLEKRVTGNTKHTEESQPLKYLEERHNTGKHSRFTVRLFGEFLWKLSDWLKQTLP